MPCILAPIWEYTGYLSSFYSHWDCPFRFFSFLFFGLTLGVPFMGYYYARTYREQSMWRLRSASCKHGYSSFLCICLRHSSRQWPTTFISGSSTMDFIVNTYMGMFDDTDQ